MMTAKWLGLQMFAEGGDGAGAAATGETPADAGQDTGVKAADAEQRLLGLGVPAEKARKYRGKGNRTEAPNPNAAAGQEPDGKPPAAEDAVTGSTEEAPPARMSWDEIMQDPEYNRQMQSVVQQSVKRYKNAEENLAKLAPALELIARQKGMDTETLDYDALARSINEDASYYEGKALELGIPVEQAMKVDQAEREAARQRKAAEQDIREQQFRQHLIRMESQGEELKKTFPGFDLRTELQNPVFARLTSPGVGLSVEDAYHAVHRKEIDAARNEVIARQTMEQASRAIQSGSRRPVENGISGAAPSVTTFDYRNASKEQREALKQRIRDAAARGEKIYPGQ